MEKNNENNAFYAIKVTGSDRPSVPTLAAIVAGQETTRPPNVLFNIPGSANRRRDKEAKKEAEEEVERNQCKEISKKGKQ